ncbi:phage holin family protein [Actinomycetaceae bacterium TAE3-ERU4]|nr:phage holin family protein [Actinomycetaceae bacterium TAE3-ERU4]
MNFIFTILGNMAGLWVSTLIVPGLAIVQGTSRGETFVIYALLGLILTLLNMLVRPILKFLTFPLYILTFGLFSLVVNAIIISLAGWLSNDLFVSGFFAAILTGLITSVIASLVTGLLADRR